MSLTLKLLVLLLSYGILWFQVHLDYKKPWSDKRTRLHKAAFALLTYVLLPCGIAGSLAVVVLDDRAAQAADAQLAAIRSTLDSVARVVGVTAPAEIAKAVADLKDRVAAQHNELATAERTIQDLEVKAEKAARGITETFDYNGARRVSPRPGHVNLIDGPETAVFKRMVELQGAQQWSELRAIAEKQSRSTPDWLTPYLFLGVAQANLGNKAEALRAFQHVVAKAHGDPAYAEAEQLIKRLQAGK